MAEPPPKALAFRARFWRWSWRRFAVAVALSMAAHVAFSPFSILPDGGLEVRDVEGELSLPVDVLTGAEWAEAPPPPPPEAPAATGSADGPGGRADGGAHSDDDGGSDAGPDADAGPPRKAPRSRDAGAGDGGDSAAVAEGNADGGPGGLARDAVGAMGLAGKVQAGPQNVLLVINVAEGRKNGLLAELGPFVQALPQWRDFLEGVPVDPLEAASWVSLNGPSLLHTERDAVLVGYTVPDAVVDGIVDSIAQRSPGGGPVDVGVPGVRAAAGYGDRARRVFLRPRPHLLAVVPPDYAPTAARILRDVKGSPPLRPKEVVYFRILRPKGAIPALPECLEELRFSVKLAPRDALDVRGEGECGTAAQAASAAQDIDRRIAAQNSLAVRLLTRGLLNDVTTSSEGSLVKIQLTAERGQLEALLALAAGRLGVDWVPPSVRERAGQGAAPPR